MKKYFEVIQRLLKVQNHISSMSISIIVSKNETILTFKLYREIKSIIIYKEALSLRNNLSFSYDRITIETFPNNDIQIDNYEIQTTEDIFQYLTLNPNVQYYDEFKDFISKVTGKIRYCEIVGINGCDINNINRLLDDYNI